MSTVDVVLRGGTIYDGTGGEPFIADVAIANGVVVQVGEVSAKGREEIDATGKIVTPGWVDVHTHYDGQVTWDGAVTPSSALGATTIVMGNCGVGFAPVKPEAHDMLVRLMEGVEDIPGAALHEGLDWRWESFADYMAAIDERPHDIDICAQIPHGALRVYVMGERGARREAATPEEIAEMRRLTAEAVRAGAIGFSTSRTLIHRTSDGDLTPTIGAAWAELEGIALGLKDAGAGVLQFVSDFSDLDAEFDLFEHLTRISGRPLSFSLLQNDVQPEQWRTLLARLHAANEKGLPIKAQVGARPVGLLLGLQGSVHPFVTRPSYMEIAHKPLAERVEIMRDPAFRARLLAEEPLKGHPFTTMVGTSFEKMYDLGDPPNYEPDPETSFGARAAREGVDPAVLVYDTLVADGGTGFLYFPLLNYTDGNLDAAREMMVDPYTVPGLSDGGAHVGVICDVSFPTYLLTHWARDRTRGPKIDLADLIKRQTRDTAELVGLMDRGLVAPGYRADLNVIDFERLQLRPPHMVFDLPAQTRRLMQEADGYVATLVNGEVIYRDGEPTGARPGRLVRGHRGAPVIAQAAE